MMYRSYIATTIIILVVVLVSCTSSRYSTYDSDYPLTNEIAKSKSGVLNVRIPQGWYSVLENDGKGIDLWLVKEDYSASLSFMAFNINSELQRSGNTLASILNFSKILKEKTLIEPFKQVGEDESFRINSFNCTGYKYYSNEGLLSRVVVFSYQEKYYELTAQPVKIESGASIESEELFSIQNSVIASLSPNI